MLSSYCFASLVISLILCDKTAKLVTRRCVIDSISRRVPHLVRKFLRDRSHVQMWEVDGWLDGKSVIFHFLFVSELEFESQLAANRRRCSARVIP